MSNEEFRSEFNTGATAEKGYEDHRHLVTHVTDAVMERLKYCDLKHDVFKYLFDGLEKDSNVPLFVSNMLLALYGDDDGKFRNERGNIEYDLRALLHKVCTLYFSASNSANRFIPCLHGGQFAICVCHRQWMMNKNGFARLGTDEGMQAYLARVMVGRAVELPIEPLYIEYDPTAIGLRELLLTKDMANMFGNENWMSAAQHWYRQQISLRYADWETARRIRQSDYAKV